RSAAGDPGRGAGPRWRDTASPSTGGWTGERAGRRRRADPRRRGDRADAGAALQRARGALLAGGGGRPGGAGAPLHPPHRRGAGDGALRHPGAGVEGGGLRLLPGPRAWGRRGARATAAQAAPREASLAETVWTAALMTFAAGTAAGALLFAFAPGLAGGGEVDPPEGGQG